MIEAGAMISNSASTVQDCLIVGICGWKISGPVVAMIGSILFVIFAELRAIAMYISADVYKNIEDEVSNVVDSESERSEDDEESTAGGLNVFGSSLTLVLAGISFVNDGTLNDHIGTPLDITGSAMLVSGCGSYLIAVFFHSIRKSSEIIENIEGRPTFCSIEAVQGSDHQHSEDGRSAIDADEDDQNSKTSDEGSSSNRKSSSSESSVTKETSSSSTNSSRKEKLQIKVKVEN
ncbi:hypothetical protein HDU83_009248 [Entophlyctis luteolus]|nr:hypothetical protein HDU83_009248 [Entophlyctis luteolus]